MKVRDIVKFNDKRFFEGAVQLGWVEKRKKHAKLAAKSFVFHGPKYHGVSETESSELDKDYQLKDTASFALELLTAINQGISGVETNPYWLVVAGYGSGKSHLAVTCSELLSSPASVTSKEIIAHIIQADQKVGLKVQEEILLFNKPSLILPLDGMSGFHLGNALINSVYKQLEILGIDADPIRALSPRFKTAEEFVERNFDLRKENFESKLNVLTSTEICDKLRQNDEDVYFEVDSIYTKANGRSIPVEGQESAQDLLDVLSNVYCGPEGHFSSVVILFDEFGRYLEYAGEKPHLAGDSALQQIFQGIQDNSSKIRFLGFIQYELKEYLKRFSGSGLKQLQRYVTRFETSKKFYLSSNLETIFANVIGKDEDLINKLWSQNAIKEQVKDTHVLLSKVFKQMNLYPVWSDIDLFEKIIEQGCWPLHPLTVWFLSRQKDIVQSRSALSYIRDAIELASEREVTIDNYNLSRVSAAELVLNSMIPELIAAERDTGGITAETVQVLLEKFSSYLNKHGKLILVAVAILEKIRIGKHTKETVEALLSEATALKHIDVDRSIRELSELGALEWNSDLGKFELLSDGASRAQFQQWLRKSKSLIDESAVQNLFIRRAAVDIGLVDIDTQFAQSNNIKTKDWYYAANHANCENIEIAIVNSFKDWDSSILPKESKGKVIYLYLGRDNEQAKIDKQISKIFCEQLAKYGLLKAPIWVIAIDDNDGLLAEKLRCLYIFDEKLSSTDSERYRRFIPEEIDRCKDVIRELSIKAQKKNNHWVAGFNEVPIGRKNKIANAIFTEIYDEVISFPFDGFATTVGRGPKLNSDISRALIARQMNGPWIQSQNAEIRNRCEIVLSQTWQVLNKQGKLTQPKDREVKRVFDWVFEMHNLEPDRMLFQTYVELIKPPFGLNASSAGLLLGVFIGLDLPPRRVEYKGVVIATSDWLTHLYKGNAKNYFNKDTLKLSRIIFLDEDNESRWRMLLEIWESERNYSKTIELSREAENLLRDDPIPEILEPRYNNLVTATNEIIDSLKGVEKRLLGLEGDLEKVERTESVSHAIRVGGKFVKLMEEVADEDVWPSNIGKDCNKYISYIHNFLSSKLIDWINRQNCTNAMQVSDFRYKMEQNIQNLKRLNFTKESNLLYTQINKSILKVEALQQFKLTLDECKDYPRQPLANKSTKVRFLRDEIEKGELLIDALDATKTVLTEEEILSITNAIKFRQNNLKKTIKDRQNDMSVLFEQPNSHSTVKNIILHAELLASVFIGTADELEIKDIIKVLTFVSHDVETWNIDNLTPERAREILKSNVKQKMVLLNKVIDEDEIEPPWDIEAIYQYLLRDAIDEVEMKSTAWANDRLILMSEVSKLSRENCIALISEFKNSPPFLAEVDKNKILDLEGNISKRLAILDEERRSVKVSLWMKPIVEADNFEALDLNKTKSLIQLSEKPPAHLSQEETNSLSPFIDALKARLDQLDTEDLITRIKRLPKKNLMRIYELLKSYLKV